MKTHLQHVISDVKLTIEEFTTILAQVEAVLNSRPLVSIPCDDNGIEPLTPGHFLIGKPLDSPVSYRPISLLRRWHLCQSLVRHFWKRWSTEYLSTLRRYTKWHHPTRNPQIGDIVILQEDNFIPSKWPLGRIIEIHSGRDGLVRVVQVKTSSGTYRRPTSKIAYYFPQQTELYHLLLYFSFISVLHLILLYHLVKTVRSWPAVCWCMRMRIVSFLFDFLYVNLD